MASVYVGTYGKYNNGSLAGGWLDLADYPKYSDFLAACRKLHKNERDPEFMIQDTEDFPDGLSCMEWLSEQDFNDVKLAMREEQQESEGKPALNIIEYSERSFAVVGDTKAVKAELKAMGGCFNGKLSCGAGWIFSNKKREAVEKFISSGEVAGKVLAGKPQVSNEGRQFVEWLKEFFDAGGDEYYKKCAVGAIKLHDGYYLIEKPSINNRFCFHDEGPQYEFYKDLMSADSKLASYFKSENLASFDIKIRRIEKGDDYDNDKRVWWYASGTQHKVCLQFYTDTWDEDKKTLCTEEEKQLILKGLKFGRDQFEKRLDAYLKRYGTSKLHTWTYWADA